MRDCGAMSHGYEYVLDFPFIMCHEELEFKKDG